MRNTWLQTVGLMAVVMVGLSAAEGETASSADASKLKPGFYIEPGVSALIFNAPKRDDFPIYSLEQENNSTYGFGKLPVEFDNDGIVPEARIALGFVFEDMPKFLGENFRAELSSNFFWHSEKQSGTMPNPGLDNEGGTTGRAFINPLIFDQTTGLGRFTQLLTTLLGDTLPGSLPSIAHEAEYRYVDGNLTLKTDYKLGDRFALSPSLGFMYANLDQDFKTRFNGSANSWDSYYLLKERLDTDYVGATIGLDLNIKVLDKLYVVVGGTVSPLSSNTTMSTYAVTDIRPAGGVKDEDDEFTFQLTGMGKVVYQPLSWFKITGFGGVEYWDAVASVKYPNYTPTEIATSTSRLPKIGYDSMTNFRAGLNFTFTIGK